MRTKQPEDDGSDEDLEGIDEEEEEKEIEEITRGDVPEEQNWAGVDDPDMGAKGMGFSQDQNLSIGGQPPPDDPKKTRTFDFRNGTMPRGVEVIGDGEIVEQHTGATMLKLGKGAYVKLPLGIETEQARKKKEKELADAKKKKKTGKNEEQQEEKEEFWVRELLNNYTLIMDVKIDKPPTGNGLSLYQSAWPTPHYTDECYISPKLGVGLDENFGEGDAVTCGKWTRIALTVGNDMLTTYVGGKKCTAVTKREIGIPNGRFAVDPDGLLLFASSKGSSAEVAVKYVKFVAKKFNDAQIKEKVHVDSLYSQWCKDRMKQDEETRNKFSLRPLFRKAYPIWADPAFWGEFCDPFLAGTALGGGAPVNLLKVLHFTAKGTLADQLDWMPTYEERDLDHCLAIVKDLERAIPLHKRAHRMYEVGVNGIVSFLKHLHAAIGALEIGQALLIPYTASAVFILIKTSIAYRFVVCRGGKGINYHSAVATLDSKVKYSGTIVIDVSKEKINDDAWWSMLYVVSMSPKYSEDQLYSYLLPFLSGKPIAAAVAQDPGHHRTPPRSPGLALYRSMLEATRYLLLWRGLTEAKVKVFTFNMRRQMLKYAIHDLTCLKTLMENDRHLVRIACKQLAHAAVKRAKTFQLSPIQLQSVKADIDAIEEVLNKVEVVDNMAVNPPPLLDLDTTEDRKTTWYKHPLMDRLLRPDDVDGLAGPPKAIPRFVPVNLLLVRQRVTTFQEALDSMRYADMMCTLMSEQNTVVKQDCFLKVALLQHLFTQVIPCPRSRGDPLYESCIWAQPCKYMAQLDVLVLMKRIVEHFASSVLAIPTTRSLDTVRLIVCGVMFCIADAMLRKLAIDIPSVISQHLLGWETELPYGVGPGAFAYQTDTGECTTPELCVARTGVLDYFANLDVPEENMIFTWERGLYHHQSLDDFVTNIATHLGWNQTTTKVWDYITGLHNKGPLLEKNYPEWKCYRDIAFYYKLFMWSKARDQLPRDNHHQLAAQLHWEYQSCPKLYRVQAFGTNLKCNSKGSRYASKADPSHFTMPHKVSTEDDLLHIKNLPDFKGVMNQRDSELLLSYLTVPYMRLPLVLSFFSTADRIHTLRSTELQEVLDAVLFEPHQCLSAGFTRPPKMVPTEDRRLLGTPYGLLLNELHRSPEGLMGSLHSFLKQGLECDSGTPYSTETELILYTVRVAARVENALHFLVAYAKGTHPSLAIPLRAVDVTPHTLEILQNNLDALQETLRGDVRNMLESWIAQCIRKYKVIAADPKSTKHLLDFHVALACKLHAHLVLLFRNVTAAQWDVKFAGTLLSSFTYLANRHTWKRNCNNAAGSALHIPETELWEVMQVQRRDLIMYLSACSGADRDQILEAVVRVTTDSGGRVAKANDVMRCWESFPDPLDIGRFGRAQAERSEEQKAAEAKAEEERKEKEIREREARKKQALKEEKRRAAGLKKRNQRDTKADAEREKKPKRAPRVVKKHQEGGLDLEMNLQTCQLTLRSSNLKALDSDVANNQDVKEVFKDVTASMQCAMVESATNREWMRLVGRDHDVYWWTTKDDEKAELMLDREYDPGDLFPSEEWVKDLFEPVRLALFDDPLRPIPILMPDNALPETAGVAYLVASHPKEGGTWKEIYVYRHFKCVHIYNVHSYGRRWYRSLWFTTDVRFTLRELTPCTGSRCRNPPMLFRRAAAAGVDGETQGIGCVVMRDPVVPQNISGTQEQFIPARLLFGIVPQALLDKYNFWQDDNDNIRGYMKEGQGDHYICIRMDDATLLDHQSIEKSLSAKITIVPLEGNIKKRTVTEAMLLLNLLYAPEGTALFSLAQLMARLENLSHVLVWTKNVNANQATDQLSIDLVQLPRLKLTFAARWDAVAMEMRLVSLDHANMFVSNVRNDLVVHLCRGIPHCILLSDPNDELRLLVPGVNAVRPQVASAPFSTELVLCRQDKAWAANMETPYYLFHVHISMSFLHCPTLASALYLLWLRLAFRDYGDASRLVDSIATDIEFSKEENQIFENLGALRDGHPNAHAVRCKISHVVMDSPLVTPWYMPAEMAAYISSICHISAQCQLEPEEQLLLLQESELLFKKERVIHYIVTQKFHREAFKGKLDSMGENAEKVYKYLQRAIFSALHQRVTTAEVMMLLQRVLEFQTFPLLSKCLLRNRNNQLEALRTGHTTFAVRVPPRGTETRWVINADTAAIGAESYSWQYIGRGLTHLEYTHVNHITGTAAVSVAYEMLTARDPETMEGKHGFLFLYDLLTGSTKFKLGNSQNARSWVFLLLQLLHPHRRRPRVMSSILELAQLNLEVAASFPKFSLEDPKKTEEEKKKAEQEQQQQKGRRQQKKDGDQKQELNGKPGGPLDNLFTAIVQILEKAKEEGTLVLPSQLRGYARPPKHPKALEIPANKMPSGAQITKAPYDVVGHFPAISNFMCTERVLEPITVRELQTHAMLDDDLASKMAISPEEMGHFTSVPLQTGLDLDQFTVRLSRQDFGLAPVSEEVTFDVSRHVDAQSAVARDMQKRLDDDAKVFAGRENSSLKPKLKGLLDADLEGLVASGSQVDIQKAVDHLLHLRALLKQLKDKDSEYVTLAIPIVQRLANYVQLPFKIDTADAEQEDDTNRYTFFLRRYSEHETEMWLELLISSLMSSRAVEDWARLNPFVSPEVFQTGMRLVTGMLLKANRIGHINRIMEMCMDLVKMLRALAGDGPKPKLAGMVQKADALAGALLTGRHFVARDGPETYDPRFLVFEFTWNIMLRKEQVALVREFMSSLRSGKSLVKQMIMGAGKTTVVSPLLALMLADGDGLVMEVVPSPLLEFSRSVLRKIFSSVMHKRIYTFIFDRASEPGVSHVRKLQSAIQHGGIVVASSVAVKSVMLRLVEFLGHINDPTRHRPKQLEKDVTHMTQVIRLFQTGTLMMDEVDLILHPLKSELNFPVGARHDLDLAPFRWRLAIHLLDAVFAEERGGMSVPFKESTRAVTLLTSLKKAIQDGYECRAFQRSPHLVLLDPGFYHTHMKPILVDWLLLWLEAQQLAGITPDVTRRYLLGGYDDKEACAAVQALLQAEGRTEEDHHIVTRNVRLLNLGHDWLGSFMPHVLQKIDRVSFGIMTKQDYEMAIQETPNMPLSRLKLAIPFEGKDVPSRASEFAHPDVIIGLSILAYRYEGLRYGDFLEVVASLRSSLEKETGPYKLRKANQRYEQWVREAGGSILTRAVHKAADEEDEAMLTTQSSEAEAEEDTNEVVSLRFLKQSNEVQMEKLFKLFRLLPDVIHWYLNEFVFPTHTPHQVVKLSASGQEVGGDMLFGRRLGFSGTPSDLLPKELGRCGYEEGTDGLMMHTLQDPGIVDHVMLQTGWSVKSLLDEIAYANPPFHALIDTGALITGFSNLQVAKYLLSEDRLPGFEGVVFLDELGRKVVLMRATGRVVLLEECGMSLEKRFAFYDQVHTTGMDITHTPNASAVVTLGKDMTFRDYSQGAFRMRGILRGQKVKLFVIPEVAKLIQRELAAAKYPKSSVEGNVAVLREVVAWLVINSMRSERIQFNQLCIQSVANVWRKNAFRNLLDGYHMFSTTKTVDDEMLLKSLETFNEAVGFTVASGVPKPVLVTDLMQSMEDANTDLISTDSDHTTIKAIADSMVKAAEASNRLRLQEADEDDEDMLARDSSERVFNAEIVQEKAQEKEQQREAVIEIEKEEFVDRMYSRDQEEPVRWPFESLRQSSPPGCFYAASSCALHMRRPLNFPGSMWISNNYFDPKWSGDRRMKNVVMVLEWCPSRAAVALSASPMASPAESAKMDLKRVLELYLFDRASKGQQPLTPELVEQLVELCFDAQATGLSHNAQWSPDAVMDLVYGAAYRQEHENRYFVGMSLAEAETIRRILHMNAEGQVIADTDVGMALRCVPANFSVTDASWQFTSAEYPRAPNYQEATVYNAFRFFDCDTQYLDDEVNCLLKMLQTSTRHARSTYFRQILACRRRIQKCMDNTPVSRVFHLGNEFHHLQQRVQSLRIRQALVEKKVSIYDAFCHMNHSKSGFLSLGELMAGLKWLQLDLESEKQSHLNVIDFLDTADQDEDGKLSYNEFWEAVCDPKAKKDVTNDEEDPETVEHSKSDLLEKDPSMIEPQGEEVLAALRRALIKQKEEEDAAEVKRQEEEDMARQLEAERIYDEEEKQAGRPPNPHYFTAQRVKRDPAWEHEEEKRRKKKEMMEVRKRMSAGFKVDEAEDEGKEKEEKEEKAEKKEEPLAEEEPVEMTDFAGVRFNFSTGKLPKKAVQFGYTEHKKVLKQLTDKEEDELVRAKLPVGCKVEARWRIGFPYLPGTITKINDDEDRTYAIQYDNGNFWGEVPLWKILIPEDDDDDMELDDGRPREKDEKDDGIPRKIALKVSAQGFLKLPLAELAGNGGGQNLNQYTLQFAVCQQGQHWSGSVLLKNDHGLTVRIRHGMLTVDGLGWEGTSVWDKKEDVEWSYKKHGKWLPFSMAQTMELEKEYSKNKHGACTLTMDKATMHCDFVLLKMQDEKGRTTFDMKRMDADARWKERFASSGFTDEMLKADPSVDWATRLKSTTQWSDDEEDEIEDKVPTSYASRWGSGQVTWGEPVNIGSSWWKGRTAGPGRNVAVDVDGSDSDDSLDWDAGEMWSGWGGWADWGKKVGKVSNHGWHHVVIVVNLGQASKVVTYVDGVESKSYRNKDKLGDVDGEFSLVRGEPLYIFGGLNVPSDEMRGGGIMDLEISDYAASLMDVEALYAKAKGDISIWNQFSSEVVEDDTDDEDDYDDDDDDFY